MMPTPDQEARLKSCKSSAEYDAEWQRITNENLQTMTERAAAEIRALREQEADFYFLDQFKQSVDNSRNSSESDYNRLSREMRLQDAKEAEDFLKNDPDFFNANSNDKHRESSGVTFKEVDPTPFIVFVCFVIVLFGFTALVSFIRFLMTIK